MVLKFVVSDETFGEFLLISSSILFSMSFVGSRYAMISEASSIGPWTFNALRYSVSFMVLLILEPILRKHPIFQFPDSDAMTASSSSSLPNPSGVTTMVPLTNSTTPSSQHSRNHNRNRSDSMFAPLESWAIGKHISKKMVQIILIQGSSNFIASILLQIGLETLDASKAAFITSCYVVLIPFVEVCFLPIFTGEKFQCLSSKAWIEVVICTLGVYLISGCASSSVSCVGSLQDTGEFYVICSVIFWVINIMICDEAGKFHDSILLTLGDFAVVAIVTIAFSLIFEPRSWTYPFTDILSSWMVILYVGFFEAFAYLLSTVGQIYVRPSRAAIIYSGETLFTCIGGVFFLGESLNASEMLGGALILLSSVLTSVSFAVENEEDAEKLEGIQAMEMIPTSVSAETRTSAIEPKDISPLLPHHPPDANLLQQQQYQYLPPYMQMRRQRGGSISRYPLFRSKPVTHFECSRPIPINSPEPSSYDGHLSVPHYGSLPTESNMSKYRLQMEQISSSL